MGRLLALVAGLLAGAAVLEQVRRPASERTWQGAVLGIPYDFRPPTPQRVAERWWNPDDPNLLTPHVFGIGWSVNLHEVCRRVRR
jgi:Family of unknown function (DUF5808)